MNAWSLGGGVTIDSAGVGAGASSARASAVASARPMTALADETAHVTLRSATVFGSIHPGPRTRTLTAQGGFAYSGWPEAMEIYLDKRAVRQIRLSSQDAIEEGDIETLREDILEAFTEDQVEEIERRLDTGDFFEFLTDLLDEWSGDDADELMELLDTQLGDVGIDLKFEKRAAADPEEEEEDETTDFEDEEVDEDEDLDEDEDDDEEEEEEKDEDE